MGDRKGRPYGALFINYGRRGDPLLRRLLLPQHAYHTQACGSPCYGVCCCATRLPHASVWLPLRGAVGEAD